jgi:ribosomal protein S18 acetylase RimI-like enzyme
MEIRLAKSEDAKGVSEILAQAFAPFRDLYTPEAFNATVLCGKQIERRIATEGTTVLVAFEPGALVGTATVSQWPMNKFYIQSMAARPGFRGVGQRLLEHIKQMAVQEGRDGLVLETWTPLERALRLYEWFGFVKTGKVRNYYGIEIFEMEKKLRKNQE